MDLSFLKWPIIIGVIVGVGWLMSSGGVNYMYGKFTADPPGTSAAKDEVNEAGLSKLGGYCMYLFKYETAWGILDKAVTLYPSGKNRWFNEYRMVKCAEKTEKYAKAAAFLQELIAVEAWKTDERVPDRDNLSLRREKLVEMYDLEKR